MRLQLDMVKSLCGVAQKCDSNSFTLSAKPLLLRSTEKDSSFLIDARNSLKSTCVAPCFKSYCSLLRTFVIPEYFLDSFYQNGRHHREPLKYFITVSCIYRANLSSEIYWYFEPIFIFYWLNRHIFTSLF
jgi:hypothetical protein